MLLTSDHRVNLNRTRNNNRLRTHPRHRLSWNKITTELVVLSAHWTRPRQMITTIRSFNHMWICSSNNNNKMTVRAKIIIIIIIVAWSMEGLLLFKTRNKRNFCWKSTEWMSSIPHRIALAATLITTTTTGVVVTMIIFLIACVALKN